MTFSVVYINVVHPRFRHTLGENYRRQNSYNSPKSMYAMQNKVIQYCIVKERKTDISKGRVRDVWMCTSCFQSIIIFGILLPLSYSMHTTSIQYCIKQPHYNSGIIHSLKMKTYSIYVFQYICIQCTHILCIHTYIQTHTHTHTHTFICVRKGSLHYSLYYESSFFKRVGK